MLTIFSIRVLSSYSLVFILLEIHWEINTWFLHKACSFTGIWVVWLYVFGINSLLGKYCPYSSRLIKEHLCKYRRRLNNHPLDNNGKTNTRCMIGLINYRLRLMSTQTLKFIGCLPNKHHIKSPLCDLVASIYSFRLIK